MVILPILALFLIIFLVDLQTGDRDHGLSCLRGALLWGGMVVAITEALSLLRMVTQVGLVIAWLGIVVILGFLIRNAWRKGARLCRLHLGRDTKRDRNEGAFKGERTLRISGEEGRFNDGGAVLGEGIRRVADPMSKGEKLLLGLLGVMLVLTFLVAVIAPVQTWDSLSYHMTRVAHWAQDRQVHIFATGTERQNFMSPGAEFLTLHFYVLQGGDQFVNLIDWLAYLGCIAGAAWVARWLGAQRPAQLLAAMACAGIPIAISQASSTATDIVLSFWLLCLVVEILALEKSEGGDYSWLFMGLGCGLSILTKPTCFVVLMPLAVWALVYILKTWGIKRLAIMTAGVLTVTVMVNAGYLARNQAAYGNPLGPADVFTYQGNEIHTLPALISNLMRNTAVHLGTIGPVNVRLTQGIEKIHAWLKLDTNDPRTTQGPQFTVISPANEDTIGNFVSLLSFGLALIVLLARRKRYSTPLKLYTLVILGAFVLYSLIYKWQLFATRLQLPLFVLAAAVVGVVLGSWKPPALPVALGVLVFLSATVWLLALIPRPLIPLPVRTYPQSILRTPRQDLYFTNDVGLQVRMENTVERIKEKGCSEVALMISGSDAEYLWWVMLGAPDPRLRIAWLVAGTPSEKYAEADFKPCAVICTTCSRGDKPRGLTLDSALWQDLALHGFWELMSRCE